MDLVFLFWVITAGIILGVGLIPLAVMGSVVIGIMLIAFAAKNVVDAPYIVMISCDDDSAENSALKLIKKHFSRYRLKSKTVMAEKGIEIVLEIRLKSGETKFVNDLLAISGVTNATLVSFSGEYAT